MTYGFIALRKILIDDKQLQIGTGHLKHFTGENKAVSKIFSAIYESLYYYNSSYGGKHF